MRNVSYLAAATAALLTAATATLAHAQPSSVAETLFREGKTLMAAGKIAEACEAFDGSYRKEKTVSTLLNLADCREKNGQYATAWGHFIDAMRMTRGDVAQQSLFNTAKDRSVRLEGKLSYLIINVPDAARVEGLAITRNGVEVDPAEWNKDIPVDGGEYKVEGKAPAYEAWSTTVTVGKEQDKQSVNVPKFTEMPKKKLPPGEGGAEPSSFTGKRKIAAGVGAVGVVAAVVGTVMYTSASGTYDDAKAATTQADRDRLVDDANGKYLQAQILWGVGAAAVGTAAFLWFTGGPAALEATEASDGEVTFTPRITGDSAGFVVGGRF
jgi:hypothetical protein